MRNKLNFSARSVFVCCCARLVEEMQLLSLYYNPLGGIFAVRLTGVKKHLFRFMSRCQPSSFLFTFSPSTLLPFACWCWSHLSIFQILLRYMLRFTRRASNNCCTPRGEQLSSPGGMSASFLGKSFFSARRSSLMWQIELFIDVY